MKKYINGFDRPRFRCLNGINLVFDYILPFKYAALKEYYEIVAIEHEFIDGSKLYSGRFIRYEWRLFYTNYVQKADLLKLKDIEMTLFNGYMLWLYPHVDMPNRKFKIFVQPEKRELDIHSTGPAGRWNPPMKGYEISFVNADPITAIDMGDPDVDNQAEVISQESPIEVQGN